ncbi:MAG: hypothetical protein ACRBN8_43495 [Nannocystales bacterium]
MHRRIQLTTTIGIGLLAGLLSACGDDASVGTASGTGTGTEGSGAETTTMVPSDSSSSSSSSGTTPDPTGSGSSGVPACEPDFTPLQADALPRCTDSTLECWLSCPLLDSHECRSACTAADPTPPHVLDDGSTVDCGRCINRMFGSCWADACPEETLASRCCTQDSGCSEQCLAFGPCTTEDLECIRTACAPELSAQAECLEQTDGLASCRVSNGGLATQCFGP